MPSQIIQKAKNSGTTVTFASPVTAGSAIVVYAAFNDPSFVGSFIGCEDDKSQIYFGSNTLPSPWGPTYGGAYDYGYDQLSERNLQTQSFFFFPSVAGVREITVNMNGVSGDLFAYELQIPSFISPPNPSGGNPFINTILDDSADTDNSSVSGFVPSATAPMTKTTSGGLFPSFTSDTSELSMVLCIIDAGSFVSVPSNWTMDTQGSSAVMYRVATEAADSAGVTDGVFTLSEAAYFAMSADDWYSDVPPVTGGVEDQYSCNGMFDQSSRRGDVLSALCASMAGFATPPGDAWRVFAGSYVTPTLTITDDDLRGPIRGDFRLSKREAANGVKGQITPAYLPAGPAAAISLNSTPAAWAKADYPAYQANGFNGVRPNYLNTEDDGQIIWADQDFEFCSSLFLAQRLAKITLMRLRFQVTLTLQLKLSALELEAGDTFTFVHSNWGMNAVFEATQVTLAFENDSTGAPIIGVDVVARLTDPSVFAFTGPSSATDTGEYSTYMTTGVISPDEFD